MLARIAGLPRLAWHELRRQASCGYSMPRALRLVLLLLACLLLAFGAGAGQEVVVLVTEADEAFVIDAAIRAPVPVSAAWEVLTDFDGMAAILGNLSLSRVIRRDGNTLIVRQEGVAHYGPLSYAFESEREIRLEPMRRIVARNLSGTAKHMESEARLSVAEDGRGTLIRYRATVVPASMLARTIGASFMQHEVEEQFQRMVAEMKRRRPAAPDFR
jgi:carbon monoxide dehydrogenase subunit G